MKLKPHPGVYLKDALESLEMTGKEFSLRTGISERTLSGVITGKNDLSFDTAYKLAEFFDNSVDFWVNLQSQYDASLKERERVASLKEDWRLLKGIKDYLVEYHYVEPSDPQTAMVEKVRKTVGVNRLSLLNQKDLLVCLKQDRPRKKHHLFYENFWIGLALQEARKIETPAYDEEKLDARVPEIRRLSTLEPLAFIPKLKTILHDCGVRFVILPYLPESNIRGVTKWLSHDHVMLALALKKESAEAFWFTLFHELAHVLMEHKREALLTDDGYENFDADGIATEILIPHEEWQSFLFQEDYSEEAIRGFAAYLSIHPAIVADRLRREEELPKGATESEFHEEYDFRLPN